MSTYVGNPITNTVQYDGKNLELHLSEVNHSPTGLNWGYHGSGPAQCAYEILRHQMLCSFLYFELAVAESDIIEAAVRLHQRFKREVIATLPFGQPMGLDEAVVLNWLKPHLIVQLYQRDLITDEQLWHMLSSSKSHFSKDQAAEIYVELGFEPFAGFPLVRVG